MCVRGLSENAMTLDQAALEAGQPRGEKPSGVRGTWVRISGLLNFNSSTTLCQLPPFSEVLVTSSVKYLF